MTEQNDDRSYVNSGSFDTNSSNEFVSEDFDYNDFNDEIENEKIFKYNKELFELLINKDIDEDSDLDSKYDKKLIKEDNNNDD
ncbi:hypothetical protein Glove_20g21 [Diversispora epigaea]|uniref:Uncharacterized protein n=1 Tax=Diversispora epigaea TaxID=1348612 RepID=A0A397JKJ8_9GLOM|nr:hypothetical protein Glove_20g21 [Diversispora epigaea]